MAKGSGLSIDSDRIGLFLHKPPSVINSFSDHHNNNHHHHHHKWKFEPMDATGNRSSPVPSSIQFPVNLNCTHLHDLPETSDGKRTVIDEMDFFAEKKPADDDSSKAATTTTDASDKKDFNEPTELDFNVNTGLHLLTTNTSSDQSMVDDGTSVNSEDKRAKNEVMVLQAELGRVKTENERLRDMLNQVSRDYNTLQMHLMTMMQQQDHEKKGDIDNGSTREDEMEENKVNGKGGVVVPRKFMDLGLAAVADTEEPSLSSSEGRSRERSQSPPAIHAEAGVSKGGLCDHPKKEYGREYSPENGSQGWGPNKVPRMNAPKEGDQANEATMRKARVTVRARSEAPMITDGCQWRKYGQKMAKGNPCPRAYYRCTMAAGCPVRKQVQRCAEDRTILITTYEGNHNHPLPPAAMAMASTTSSAAQMLLSGSMPSADGLIPNFLARTLLPACSTSMATISASAPFPTVTLDLTQTPNPLQFQRPPNQFNVPFPPNPSQSFSAAAPSALLPQIFGQALYNQSKFSPLQMPGQDKEAAAQLAQQLSSSSSSLPPLHQTQPSSLADTVTAITADPNFTAALAAAITSIIGGAGQPNNSANAIATTSNTNGSGNNNSNGNNKVISNTNFQK